MGKDTHQISKWKISILLLMITTSLKVHALSNGTAAAGNGIVKTIQSEDGCVIHCVNLYKQPAFSHPLLKNHVIQMKPSSHLVEINSSPNSGQNSFALRVTQSWHKKKGGFCPEGTIPIAKSQGTLPRKIAHINYNGGRPNSKETDPKGHEFAEVQLLGGYFYGATANLNLWQPKVLDNEFSTAEIWVYSGPEVNSMEAGWMVSPPNLKQPTLFTYWTRDEYQSTGCYNLECPGFVQTSYKYALGAGIAPVSTYGGKQFQISLTIRKDSKSGNWWLNLQGENMGYWPSSIFTSLAESSTLISWGGEVKNSKPNGKHTSTEMGSGHNPSEGFAKASFFSDVAAYYTIDGVPKPPRLLQPYTTNEHCYNVSIAPHVDSYGLHFYYGGLGFSPSCP